jgi:MFS family permease
VLSRLLGVLRQADFRQLWLAQTVSQFGTQITVLALPLAAILVLQATPFEVAVLGALEFLPFLLFTLPAGAWVDRLPRRRVLIAADIGRAGLLLIIPASYELGVLSIWHLYAVGFGVGTFTVFFDLAYQSYLPSLVGRESLAEGNARLEVSRSAAQVLGPGTAGLLVGIAGAPVAIAADSLSYLGSAGFLARINRAEPTHRSDADVDTDRPGLRREILDGLHYFARNPYLRGLAATVTTFNFFAEVGGSIYLVFVVRELGLRPEAIGLVTSIGAMGLVIGALASRSVARRLGLGRALIVSEFLSGIGLLLVAVAPREEAMIFLTASGLIVGVALMVLNVNGVSLRQAVTPDHLLGRINATGRWIGWGTIPLGSVAGGALATAIDLRPTLAVSAIGAALACLWLLPSPIRTLRDLPEPIRAGPTSPETGPTVPPTQPITPA